MKTIKIEIKKGAHICDIAEKRIVVKNGHGGLKLYVAPGEYNEVLLICLKGMVLEVVEDIANQAQRIVQGW
jgi:hypothetical protein